METTTLVDGLCFGEGPRWRDGRLWLSDMHAHQVITVDDAGNVGFIVEVPNRPSGLGWLPDGDLLIVSMRDRRVLRYDGADLHTHADLSGLASFDCNDMVVDARGRAYVGNFGFDLHAGEAPRAAELICVEPDGSARVVADDLLFPNGTVITPDGETLIVGESWGGRLTAFDIDPAGNLSNRRMWAKLPDGAVPDGICLDAHGGIWSASPASNECLRQVEGGEVTHRVAVDQGAFACMLGGDDGRSLFILTAGASDPDTCRETRTGRVELAAAPFPRAGWP
ncbi:MAG: gluconolactonase [Pseudomonadales bacterium]|nr:SMP-30/gluconolactonase/LRE family protein [Pseudomonadales bacterium]NIX09459.1 gluconolactonase [Pseudomonadales bacterium]